MAKYGVGILGAGWVAGEYVRVFRDHPLTEIVGVYNRTPGKATRLLREHGVEATEYRTDDELFEDERVDIVVSCTPPNPRPDHVVRAANTGRHVGIEKPVALTMEGVERARRAVAAAGVKTVTSFVLRWNPEFVTIRRLLDDGIVGEVLYAEADYWNPSEKWWPCYPWLVTRAIGGSAFMPGGCHAADAVATLPARSLRSRPSRLRRSATPTTSSTPTSWRRSDSSTAPSASSRPSWTPTRRTSSTCASSAPRGRW